MLRALWQYREFVGSLVRREFQIRSARAAWGSLWLILQPAAQIFIYTVIFAQVLRAKLPGADDDLAYGLYLCSGLVTWNHFAELIGRSQTLFLEHSVLLKTIRFPRSVLPATLLISVSLTFAVIAGIFLLVLIVIGRWPGWILLAAIPIFLVQCTLGSSLGMLLGTLNVFFRDVGQVVGVLLQFWFWLTPIVYPISIVPEPWRLWFTWNPAYPIISGYQRIVLERASPDWSGLLVVFAISITLALLSRLVFRALEPDLVDEL